MTAKSMELRNRCKPLRHGRIELGVLDFRAMDKGPAIVLARLDAVHLVVGNIVTQIVAPIINAKKRPRPRLPVKANCVPQA